MEYGRIGVGPGTERIGGFNMSGGGMAAVLKEKICNGTALIIRKNPQHLFVETSIQFQQKSTLTSIL
jgi:hypothetical protein